MGSELKVEDATAIPPEALERIRRTQGERDAAEVERGVTAYKPLVARFTAEQRKIVPVELDEKLKVHVAKNRLPEDASVEDRRGRAEAQRKYAAELGIDLAALDRMRQDFATQAVKLGTLPDLGDIEVTDLADGRRPTTDARVYNGSWDPGPTWSSTKPGSFAVWNADSYFDPATNRAGSHIRFRQRETDDNTIVSMAWRNGYMVLHTPSSTSRVRMEVDLTKEFSRYFIDTDNEPGNSSCNVLLQQAVRVEIYSSWADEIPQEIAAVSAAPSCAARGTWRNGSTGTRCSPGRSVSASGSTASGPMSPATRSRSSSRCSTRPTVSSSTTPASPRASTRPGI